MQRTKKNKKKAIVACAALVGVLAIGGMSAYFTDTDNATNEFVVGKIDIELQELNWDENNAKSILPTQILEKDPQIKVANDSNPAYVFLKVKIPTTDKYIYNLDGTTKNTAGGDLFTLINSSNQAGINDGWTQLGTVDTTSETGYSIYTYAYGSSTEMTAVNADTTTSNLFNKIQAANVADQETFNGAEKNVIVEAYGIQTTNLKGTNEKTPSEVWTILNNQRDASHTNSEESDQKKN